MSYAHRRAPGTKSHRGSSTIFSPAAAAAVESDEDDFTSPPLPLNLCNAHFTSGIRKSTPSSCPAALGSGTASDSAAASASTNDLHSLQQVNSQQLAEASADTVALLSLTPDVMAAIMLRMPMHDICSLSQSCIHMRDLMRDDARLWLPLCEARWSRKTHLTAWLAVMPMDSSATADASARTTGMDPGAEAGAGLPASGRRRRGSAGGGGGRSRSGMATPAAGSSPVYRGGAGLMVDAFLATALDSVDPGRKLSPQPGSYRSLYRLLLGMELVAGTWRGVGSGPEGTLFHIGWRNDHLEAVQLMCSTGQLDPLPRCSLFRLGPGYPHVVADVVGKGTHCVIKEYVCMGGYSGGSGNGMGGSGGGGRNSSGRPRALSEAAEAAAAVAAGGGLSGSQGRGHKQRGRGGASEPLMGSSPPSSFGYELAHFMQASVAQSRSSARRTISRGVRASSAASSFNAVNPPSPQPLPAGGSPCSPSPPLGQVVTVSTSSLPPVYCYSQTPTVPTGVPLYTHTFVRVAQPRRSKQHPLAGLWKGVHGRSGAQVSSVQYDFQGSTARIVATKVTGDRDVNAGIESWAVGASPLPQPWSSRERRLVAGRARLARAAAREGGGNAVGQQHPQQVEADQQDELNDPLAFLQLGDEDVEEDSDDADGGGDEGGLGAWAAAATLGADVDTAAKPDGKVVIAVYHGKGRLGLPDGGCCWVEGRLWLYNTGGIGFVWLRNRQLGPGPQGHNVGGDGDGGDGALLVDYQRLDTDTATG